jgi:hypothetical protein
MSLEHPADAATPWYLQETEADTRRSLSEPGHCYQEMVVTTLDLRFDVVVSRETQAPSFASNPPPKQRIAKPQ